ncbi:MAG: 4Fe-4S binding protein [Proteobacteria bacterium]|nr:4Fe-4S binding protein [Pseudomonadota bacterium]
MKALSVFSGKGGTGKTTLVACFARLAPSSVVIDCDVDAANLALIVAGKDVCCEPFSAGQKAKVQPAKCDQCGACQEACRFGAVIKTSKGFRIDPLQCEGCGVCALVCPRDAVSFSPNQVGQWMVRQVNPPDNQNWLVHAALKVGQDNSGKLVAKIKEVGEKLAIEARIELLLVDGPPGIGCPVHAAFAKTDAILAVAEPTVSGEHDLLRLLDLARHFNVKAMVAINKWDLCAAKTESIETLARERNVPIVGRIPFDPSIPRMLAQRRLPLEEPASKNTVLAIKEVWKAFVG